MSWTQGAAGLEQLEPATRRALDQLVPFDVASGTVLFRPGDTVKGYIIVLKGEIGVNLIGPAGRDILLYRVQPGQSCIQSTLGLMGGEDYSGEAVAQTDARIVVMSRTEFLGLIDRSAEFRRMVFAAFAERMQSMMHLLERVAFQKVAARLASYLLDQADADGVLRITQAELATAIGTAREVVSRRLYLIGQRGHIAHERGLVRITNPEALRQMAEFTGM